MSNFALFASDFSFKKRNITKPVEVSCLPLPIPFLSLSLPEFSVYYPRECFYFFHLYIYIYHYTTYSTVLHAYKLCKCYHFEYIVLQLDFFSHCVFSPNVYKRRDIMSPHVSTSQLQQWLVTAMRASLKLLPTSSHSSELF